MKEEIYILTQDGKVLFEGTNDECHWKLLDIQSASCHHALKYEGYKITLKSNK